MSGGSEEGYGDLMLTARPSTSDAGFEVSTFPRTALISSSCSYGTGHIYTGNADDAEFSSYASYARGATSLASSSSGTPQPMYTTGAYTPAAVASGYVAPTAVYRSVLYNLHVSFYSTLY